MIKLDKNRAVNPTTYITPRTFVCVTSVMKGCYALECMSEKGIGMASSEGSELFFNVLPHSDQEDNYNDIVIYTIKNGGDIDHLSAKGGDITVLFSDVEKVYAYIDELCTPANLK